MEQSLRMSVASIMLKSFPLTNKLAVALNKVPRDEAALMTNKTYPILGQEVQYMIALDVFHQLHCLVSVHFTGFGFYSAILLL